jgi:hypothetical protein
MPMSTWTLNVLGPTEGSGPVAGTATDEAAAVSAALDALASALARHAELGQRRYTVRIDDSVLAILGTGRDHHDANRESLDMLLATIRRSTPVS